MPFGAVSNQRSLVALNNLLEFIVTYTIHLQAAIQKKRVDVMREIFGGFLLVISLLSVSILVRLTSKVLVLYQSDQMDFNILI